MRIKNIVELTELEEQEGLMDIVLDVDLDQEVASRWELVNPKVWAVYRKYGEYRLDYLELVDNGMNVHGFEFTDREKKEILSFIEAEILRQSGEGLLN